MFLKSAEYSNEVEPDNSTDTSSDNHTNVEVDKVKIKRKLKKEFALTFFLGGRQSRTTKFKNPSTDCHAKYVPANISAATWFFLPNCHSGCNGFCWMLSCVSNYFFRKTIHFATRSLVIFYFPRYVTTSPTVNTLSLQISPTIYSSNAWQVPYSTYSSNATIQPNLLNDMVCTIDTRSFSFLALISLYLTGLDPTCPV